jgi:hypothetical protein
VKDPARSSARYQCASAVRRVQQHARSFATLRMTQRSVRLTAASWGGRVCEPSAEIKTRLLDSASLRLCLASPPAPLVRCAQDDSKDLLLLAWRIFKRLTASQNDSKGNSSQPLSEMKSPGSSWDCLRFSGSLHFVQDDTRFTGSERRRNQARLCTRRKNSGGLSDYGLKGAFLLLPRSFAGEDKAGGAGIAAER